LDVQKENWNGIGKEAVAAAVAVVASEGQDLTRGDTIEPLSVRVPIAVAPEEAGWSCTHSQWEM